MAWVSLWLLWWNHIATSCHSKASQGLGPHCGLTALKGLPVHSSHLKWYFSTKAVFFFLKNLIYFSRNVFKNYMGFSRHFLFFCHFFPSQISRVGRGDNRVRPMGFVEKINSHFKKWEADGLNVSLHSWRKKENLASMYIKQIRESTTDRITYMHTC